MTHRSRPAAPPPPAPPPPAAAPAPAASPLTHTQALTALQALVGAVGLPHSGGAPPPATGVVLVPPGPHSGRLSGRLPSRMLTGSLRLPGFARIWWAYGLALIATCLLLLQILGALASLIGTWHDTLTYGDPRTTHLVAAFGLRGEDSTAPTLVTAVNVAGEGYLFVLPGGAAANPFVLTLPVTDLDPQGRAPLLLTAEDVDRDGHADLVVQVGDGGPHYVYLTDTGKNTLRPPTPDELARIFGRGGSR